MAAIVAEVCKWQCHLKLDYWQLLRCKTQPNEIRRWQSGKLFSLLEKRTNIQLLFIYLFMYFTAYERYAVHCVRRWWRKMKCYFSFSPSADGVCVCQSVKCYWLALIQQRVLGKGKLRTIRHDIPDSHFPRYFSSNLHSPIPRSKCTSTSFSIAAWISWHTYRRYTCLRSNIKRAPFQHNPATIFPLL